MTAKVQDEIRQVRPFSSREEEAFVTLLRTADVLNRQVEDIMKAVGLSGTQYNVLRILRGAGGEGLRCSDIGSRMISREPDITRLLDRLEKRGFITRRREEKDRRVVTTRITPEGLKVLKELDPEVRELHRRQLGHMGRSGLEQLTGLLDRAREPL